jgi:hypothetical protein
MPEVRFSSAAGGDGSALAVIGGVARGRARAVRYVTPLPRVLPDGLMRSAQRRPGPRRPLGRRVPCSPGMAVAQDIVLLGAIIGPADYR